MVIGARDAVYVCPLQPGPRSVRRGIVWEKHVKPLWVESGEVPPDLICVRVFR